jgi:hypothetical protein
VDPNVFAASLFATFDSELEEVGIEITQFEKVCGGAVRDDRVDRLLADPL